MHSEEREHEDSQIQSSRQHRGVLQEIPDLLPVHWYRIRTKGLKENLVFMVDTTVDLLHHIRDYLPRATILLVLAPRRGVDELLTNHGMGVIEEVLQLILRHPFGRAAGGRGRGKACSSGRSRGHLGRHEPLGAGRVADIKHSPSPFIHASQRRFRLAHNIHANKAIEDTYISRLRI